MRNCDWQGSDYKNSRKRYSIIISHFVTTLIAEKDAFQENHLGNNENAFLGIVIIKLLVLLLVDFFFGSSFDFRFSLIMLILEIFDILLCPYS